MAFVYGSEVELDQEMIPIVPHYPPKMENQMEKNKENEMETRGI